MVIDGIDEKILHSLQKDARKTATAVAAEIGLTVAPTLQRIRELESSKVLKGYYADIDLQKLGLGFEAIVFASLTKSDSHTLKAFESQVLAEPRIIEAQRLFGDIDYVLTVVAEDLPAYQRLYDEVLSYFAGVERLTSTIVMKKLKKGPNIPF